MTKVVKPKNLIIFRLWLIKLGYQIKELADGGFTFKGRTDRKKDSYGFVSRDLTGNDCAYRLGRELQAHLKSFYGCSQND